MENYSEIDGDLITLAQTGHFDVIAHGCNCFCTMGAGIAPQMAKAFGADQMLLEKPKHSGDINKLGQIDSRYIPSKRLTIVNAYTQYGFRIKGSNESYTALDYEALILCMRKMNRLFHGKKIGLPQIGCGLAGGDWEKVKAIIQAELTDCEIIIVNYKAI